MRICVCGAACVGKSTFIKDFLENWPSYQFSGETYRAILDEKNIKLNKEGNQESQEAILNCLLDAAMEYPKDSKVVHDRGTLDNLVYTLRLKGKDDDCIDDNFLQRTFQLVKESMFFYDVIFYIPYNDQFNTDEVKETRETDVEFNSEVDNFFKALISMYHNKNNKIFPFDDERGVPAIIEVFGNREERIELAKLYIDPDGEEYSDDDSLINEFLSPEEVKDLQQENSAN